MYARAVEERMTQGASEYVSDTARTGLPERRRRRKRRGYDRGRNATRKQRRIRRILQGGIARPRHPPFTHWKPSGDQLTARSQLSKNRRFFLGVDLPLAFNLGEGIAAEKGDNGSPFSTSNVRKGTKVQHANDTTARDKQFIDFTSVDTC